MQPVSKYKAIPSKEDVEYEHVIVMKTTVEIIDERSLSNERKNVFISFRF